MTKNILEEHNNHIRALAIKLFMWSGYFPEESSELERQVLSAYCFGMVNGYAQENKMSPAEVHGSMLGLLILLFNYDESSSAALCSELIRSMSSRHNNSVNALIHRGLEGYYMITEQRANDLKNDVHEIMQIVKGAVGE